MPTDTEVCAIIPAWNEASSLPNVFRQLLRAGVGKAIVVANGCTDDTVNVAEDVGKNLLAQCVVQEFPFRLGPDVPRAVGMYEAIRRFGVHQLFVIVDGDFQGSFGPNLALLMEQARTTEALAVWMPWGQGQRPFRDGRVEDVLHVADFWGEGEPNSCPTDFPFDSWSTLSAEEKLWLARDLWRFALRRSAAHLCTANPALSPTIINGQLLRELSPSLLSQPGNWFAQCIKKTRGKRLAVGMGWDVRAAGNSIRSNAHSNRMADTILGDTLEGCRVLLGMRPSRWWKGQYWDGYHSVRRFDELARQANQATLRT